MASGRPTQDAGGDSEALVIAAWKLPPIVAAIAVSIVTGFYLGGPGLGLAIGGLAAATVVAIAVRNPPRRPIVPARSVDAREHLLVVLASPLEHVGAVERIAALAGEHGETEIVVLAAARHGFLERWTSDVERGRHRAQETLVVGLASLAGAGLAASARVGDEDLVQAVEDLLGSYPATAVVLVTDADDEGSAHPAGAQLEIRLRAPFVQIEQPGRDSRQRVSRPTTIGLA